MNGCDESEDGGIVMEALRRLRRAGLIPPVAAVQDVGGDDENERAQVDVRVPITNQLRADVAQAMGDLSYELHEISPTHGINYHREP